MADVPIDPIGAAHRLDRILNRQPQENRVADQFTYNDEACDRLRITADPGPRIVTTTFGREDDPDSTASVTAPRGQHAVALAEAVLAAGGVTGYRVISQEELQRFVIHRAEQKGARSMRDRAIEALGSPQYAAAAIRALPLLPDSDEGTAADHARTLDQLATRLRGELEDEADPCRSHTVMEGIDTYCEHSSGAGHGGQHYADVAGTTRTWADPELEATPASVHAATPEGITPCGEGRLDVTVAALISEVTCVECLRAIAVERGEQIVEARRELETALGASPGTPWPTLLRQVENTVRALANEIQRPTRVVDRAAQLERDMGRIEKRTALLEVAQGRVDRLHDRVDALELAARESAQSSGTPRAQVAGGSAPEPCPVTGRNELVCIDMVCAYDLGHLSPHYNPADGGWTWDNDGNVTQLNGASPKDGA